MSYFNSNYFTPSYFAPAYWGGAASVGPTTATTLLGAIQAAYTAAAPSTVPLGSVRTGQKTSQPYAIVTMDRAPREVLRTSTDIFSEVHLCLRVYAETLAAATSAADPIAEWLDERVFSYVTAGRALVAGPFHRSEPAAKSLQGRGRAGVQFYQEHSFVGTAVRPRKQPAT